MHRHPADCLPFHSDSRWLRKQKAALCRYLAGSHKSKTFYGKLMLASSDLSLDVLAGRIYAGLQNALFLVP